MRQPFLLPPAPVFEWEPLLPEGWLDGYLDHFSASGLRLLKVCPRAWQQRYIFGRKERPGESLTLGKAVHNALGYSMLHKIKSHEDRPVTEVVDFFNDAAWPNAIEMDGGEGEIKWDNKPDVARNDGTRMVHAYHSTVSPRIQPVAVEREFKIMVPGVPVHFLGYIDFQEEHDQVDLKTGKQVQRKPDSNWRTQGTIYAMATGKPTHFHSVSRAQVPSIATPLESEEMVVQVRETQRLQIERILQDFAAQVEWFFARYGPEQDWPTTGIWMDYKGGAACNYCGFRGDCPAWLHERVV